MEKEKDFENKVKEFLSAKNIWWLKTWSNGIQRKGIPDIIACVNGYFIGIELKSDTGSPKELQLWNMEQIRDANGISIVLYPNDYEIFQNMIEEILKNGAIYSRKWHILQDRFDKFF